MKNYHDAELVIYAGGVEPIVSEDWFNYIVYYKQNDGVIYSYCYMRKGIFYTVGGDMKINRELIRYWFQIPNYDATILPRSKHVTVEVHPVGVKEPPSGVSLMAYFERGHGLISVGAWWDGKDWKYWNSKDDTLKETVLYWSHTPKLKA